MGGVSPKKFNIHFKVGKVNPFHLKENLPTTLFGCGFLFVTSKKKLNNGKFGAGFLKPNNDVSITGGADYDGICSPNKLVIECSDYVYPCLSSESNLKIPIGYKAKNGIEYSHISIICLPNVKHYGVDNGQDGKTFTAKSEEMMATDIQRFLCKKLVKNVNAYSHESLTIHSSPQSMDNMLLDEGVGHVLQVYVLPIEYDISKAYNYLKEKDLKYFSSRKSNGCFSVIAIDFFEYPNDVNTNDKFW